MLTNELNEELGNIDLYLLDQILKGRFESSGSILDAGCGEGRNSHWFVRNGKDVHFTDKDAMAVKLVRMRFRQFTDDHFVTASLDSLPYQDDSFDACICSAVLHFAEDREAFLAMWNELTRILRRDGILFVRMSCMRGLCDPGLKPGFPYSLSEEDLDMISQKFRWEEPFKSVLVDSRSMAVMVLRKL